MAEGVESSLTKVLHHGLSSGEEGDHIPGLDSLRDRVRNDERAAIAGLASQIDDDALSSALGDDASHELNRMASALRARSSTLMAAVSDASPATRDYFASALEASSPGNSMVTIADRLDHIVNLAQLERTIRSIRTVGDLGTLDLDLLERLLGQGSALAAQTLIDSLRAFGESGYVRGHGSRAVLSSRAVQKIGDSLLHATRARVEGRSSGQHQSRQHGQHHEPTGSSRDYSFGDPFDLDLSQTVMGAVKREAGTPVRLRVDDLRIHEHERSERATTILAVDLSRSMGERGYLLAAKKLALALGTFIRTRYPHDELVLVGFSESARVMTLHELVELKWDRYGFGTNVQDALRLSTAILNGYRGTRRNLVLITDGEPTAHRDGQGEVIFNHPASAETIASTYQEGNRLRRDGVYLCVCVMSAQKRVTEFGKELARYAAGDAIVSDPDNLTADLVATYRKARR